MTELEELDGLPPTPWRTVFRKFGMRQAELARAIGVDRSKISTALKDPVGLINARDQIKLMKAARLAGVKLKAADLLPEGV